jgi:hypothetical protein
MEIFNVIDRLVKEGLGLKLAIDCDLFGEVKVSELEIMLIGFVLFLYSFNHVSVGNYVIKCVNVPVKNLLLNLLNAQMFVFLLIFWTHLFLLIYVYNRSHSFS